MSIRDSFNQAFFRRVSRSGKINRKTIGWLAFLLVLSPGLSWAAPHAKKKAASAAPPPAFSAAGLNLRLGGQNYFLKGLEIPGLYRLSASQLAVLFAHAKAAGAEVIKTNAFSVGAVPTPLQTGPDQWDEKALAQLDQVAAEAQKAGLKLILSLAADGGPEGGKASYASWVGSPNPGVFYLNFQCKGWYRDYVKMLLARVNSVTGVKYGADPGILAWDLMDSPQNPQGDVGLVDQWIAEMAPFVKALSPRAFVAVTLDPRAQGVSVDLAAGQPGVDFVLDRCAAGFVSPLKWSQQIGKPVVALLDQPQALPADLGTGVLVSQAAGQEPAAALQSFFTGLSQEGGFGAKDLFASVTVVSGGAPVLSWDAREQVEVTLAQPARVTVRYGLNGLLNEETPPSDGVSLAQILSLAGLAAGTDYSYQVKAVGAQTQYSNVSVFSTPKVAALTAPPATRSNNFISVKGDAFYDGDKVFRFVGTNNYYLHFAKPESLEYVMGWAEKLGFTVMRSWAFGETDQAAVPDWQKGTFLVSGPGKFNEDALDGLDNVVNSAAKHHLRVVFALSNNWTDYGGAPMWAKYFGSSDKNDFFEKPEIKKAYQQYVAAVVNHVNHVTGVALKDDPTIMAWNLMNEPRDERDTSGKTLAAWISETAAYLKSLGVKQLVTVGSEGLRASNGTHYSGTDFILDHQSPDIDYATFHVYPSNDYSLWNLETTEAILRAYVKDAHEVLKKPVVMEEFGIDKGKPGYDRPQFVYNMMKAFFDAGGDGCGYWMLAEPGYGGDNYQLDPTQTDLCNTFVLQSNALREGKP